MNIGLLAPDTFNFPNLALMKLSAFHKKKGDSVSFANCFDNYDILYKSKIFSYTADDLQIYNADQIISGGTGYNLDPLDMEIEYHIPDYDLYNCVHAYGFLTRGCIRNCSWCIVPKKEGMIKPHMEIENILSGKMSVILLDNNVLASEHGIQQIEKMISLKIKVDFNQGLDARLIDDKMAKLLSKLKWLKPLRLACDTTQMIKPVEKAILLLRKHNCTPKNYFIFTLVNDDIKEAYTRINYLKNLNVDPFAQPYIDFSGKRTITDEQKKICRWVNRKQIFKSIDFYEYK